ncbi:MAG: type II toxin-antitoxin system HicB family antitoxin [Vulcanimicrobiaceae bacterium]
MRYTVVLDPDPEGGFTVTVPSLPAIVTQGDNVEVALANAREAIELEIEGLTERGEAPPIETGEIRLEHVEVAC